MLYTHPSAADDTGAFTRGVRLQGQGVRKSIKSVRDERGCVYRKGGVRTSKNGFLFFVFGRNVTGGTMKVDLSTRSPPLHPYAYKCKCN